MGTIDQGGYRFDVEYSVMLQKGSLHVYKDAEFIEELVFDFTGTEPNSEEIKKLVNTYIDNSIDNSQ